VAVSSDGRYVAAGGRDKLIHVFDSRTNEEIKSFSGHRDDVTCLSFQRDSMSLFSGSLDRCIKHWDLNEMGYLETLFGHQVSNEYRALDIVMLTLSQDGVSAMDCWSKAKPVSCSVDRTVRVWKVADESHLVFRGHSCSVDNVQYLTSDAYASSGQDGSLCMWKESQKKPVATIRAAHGMDSGATPRWISSMASLKVSDLLATGSHDGYLRFWKADAEDRSLSPVAQWKTNECFINAIALSSKLVVIGTGSEHRLGRWWRIKGGKNRVEVFRLPENLSSSSRGVDVEDEFGSEESSEEEGSDASGDGGSDDGAV
jgi:ribosomal RNA-processing protein 9